MKTLFIILFLFITNSYSNECKEHPVFCQIVKNKPKIDKQYAMKLSNLIHKMHLKYKIPSKIFTAILMQESGYSLKAKGKSCGIDKDNKEKCVYSDFGISQIHYKTVDLWDFDLNKLTIDLEYSVEAGAIILADFMKRYKSKDNDGEWFTRYNCGERGGTKRDTCQIYKKLVERYL